MLIHLLPFFSVIVSSLLWNVKTRQVNAFLCSSLFFSLIAFRDGGSIDDTPVYINIFNIIKNTNEYLIYIEPCMQLVCHICKYIGFSVKGVFFIYALFTAIFLSLSLPHFIHSRKQNLLYWLGLFLFHYVSCANVIVQVLASSIIFYSAVLQLKGYEKLSLFLYAVAFSVHSASIIALCLWFCIKYRFKISSKFFLKIPILFLLFGLLNASQIMLLAFENIIPNSYRYLVDFVRENQTKDQKGVLVFFSFVCYLITTIYIEKTKLKDSKLIAWIGTSLYLCSIFISFGVSYLFRIAYYFMFFIPFAFAYIPIKRKELMILSLLLITYFVYVLSCYDTSFFQHYSGSINLKNNI